MLTLMPQPCHVTKYLKLFLICRQYIRHIVGSGDCDGVGGSDFGGVVALIGGGGGVFLFVALIGGDGGVIFDWWWCCWR